MMKTCAKMLIICTALIFINAPAIGAKASANRESPAKNLIIIVMNGVRYNDAFGDKNHLYINNIWTKLRPQGTICTKFENRELTYPIPAQMSLLTGVWHVFNKPASKDIRPAYPTLFEYWKSDRKDTGAISYFGSSKSKYEVLAYSSHKDYGTAYAPEFEATKDSITNGNAIYEKALPYITEKHPSFVYLSLGSAGGNGVESEHHSSDSLCQLPGEIDACGGPSLLNAYYESIMLMDNIVYDLWDRLQSDQFYKDKTVMLVLSDHGRHTDDYNGYGDKCRGCTQLFLLAIGPGIRKDFVSSKGRTLVDVCQTAGHIFGFPTQYAKGNVMKELLQ